MRLEQSLPPRTIVLGPQAAPTFLGSRTAPDAAQVRRQLRVAAESSRQRKRLTRRAAVGCTLAAVVLTQYPALSGRRSSATASGRASH
jgi:hypothetical protein